MTLSSRIRLYVMVGVVTQTLALAGNTCHQKLNRKKKGRSSAVGETSYGYWAMNARSRRARRVHLALLGFGESPRFHTC